MTLAPDVAGPVAVWRVWDVAYVDGRPELVSPLRASRWPARQPTTASCERFCGRVASRTCTCGLYGCTDLGPVGSQWLPGRVLGCAALWGRVCEHTGGYRGAFGYPLVLFVHTWPDIPRMRRLVEIVSEGLERPLEEPLADADLDRRLAEAYVVPVHAVAGVTRSVFLRASTGLVEGVRREAARGQAARHLGDAAAHDRLDAAVGNLVRAWSASVDG